jgi:hypothetical protein
MDGESAISKALGASLTFRLRSESYFCPAQLTYVADLPTRYKLTCAASVVENRASLCNTDHIERGGRANGRADERTNGRSAVHSISNRLTDGEGGRQITEGNDTGSNSVSSSGSRWAVQVTSEEQNCTEQQQKNNRSNTERATQRCAWISTDKRPTEK